MIRIQQIIGSSISAHSRQLDFNIQAVSVEGAHTAAVPLRDALHDGEPQAASFAGVGSGFVAPVEAVEYSLKLVFQNAGTVVGNCDKRRLTVRTDIHADGD